MCLFWLPKDRVAMVSPSPLAVPSALNIYHHQYSTAPNPSRGMHVCLLGLILFLLIYAVAMTIIGYGV